MSHCRLYLITPPSILDLPAFLDQFERACDGGDVGVLQLRLKTASDASILNAAEAIIPRCDARDIAFVLNDRPDLAATLGAGGVHLGEEDGDLATARQKMGEEAVIGASCYDSIDRAIEMASAGADYVAFGSFYASTTKPNHRRPSPLLLAQWASQSTIPCVAIGGITAENAAPLVEHGADFLAVISYIWDHPEGAEAAARRLSQIIAATPPRPMELLLEDIKAGDVL